MSDEVFIRYCSPTLAGIKTANLFSSRFKDEKEMRESVRRLNVVLVKKGIRVVPLKFREGRALIYAYRPSKLLQDLQRADACSLLKERGYAVDLPERFLRVTALFAMTRLTPRHLTLAQRLEKHWCNCVKGIGLR